MLNSKKRFEVERWAGYEVLALDGSSIVGYGSKKTDARLHYSIQLSDLSVKNILVTTESTGETFRNIIPQKDQLYIADRGYSNPVGISHIVSHGADVLVRLNFGSLPLYKTHLHSELLELDKKLGEISFGETKEYRCCIKARNFEPVWGRVIAFRLDDEKAKKAQERIRSSKKVKNKKLAMERAKFILVFTTVPSDRLSKEALIELYRLRWQVELEIKRSKSLGKVDKLRCKHLESIQAWLLLNLLYQEMLKSLLDEPLQDNEVPTEELEVRNQHKREAIWARFALGSLILRASLCPIRLHDFLERRAEIEKILRKDQRYRKRVLSVDKTLALLGEIMSI
jgi:hypothetical protein